jgi:hypothetical protein
MLPTGTGSALELWCRDEPRRIPLMPVPDPSLVEAAGGRAGSRKDPALRDKVDLFPPAGLDCFELQPPSAVRFLGTTCDQERLRFSRAESDYVIVKVWPVSAAL